MSAMQDGTAAAQPAALAQPASPQLSTPNQYHLHGGGISVNYFPDGFGPVQPGGVGRFTYQDTHRSLNFNGNEIRKVEVPDLGTVVSVTLVRTVDTGATIFSLLLPHVILPAQMGASAFIQTEGITSIHPVFVAMIGHAQSEVYTVTRLHGTAVRGILPL